MVADPLREKLEVYRWDLERANRLLASPYLPMDLRPNLVRVCYNFELMLQEAEARLEARDEMHRGNPI